MLTFLKSRPVYKTWLPFVYGIILLVTFFLSYNAVFDEKVDLNGDDTVYYLLGKGLASGKGYTCYYLPGAAPHTHFPPGYPVIIAAACKLFSEDLHFVKQVNGFFFLASIALLCVIAYKCSRNVHLSFLVALFCLLNSHLLEYSVNTMSEIPFLFFILLSMVMAMNTNFDKPVYRNILFWMLVLCISFTYYIRTIGISLFVGVWLFLLFKRYWSYALACLGGFLLLTIPWYIRGKSVGAGSYIDQLVLKNAYRPEWGAMQLKDWPQRVWNNLLRYVTQEIPSAMAGRQVSDYSILPSPGYLAIALGIFLFIVGGLYWLKHPSKQLLSFILISYAGVLVLWPDVWVGTRFMLPLLPLLMLLLINGLYEALQVGLSRIKWKRAPLVAAAMMFAGAAFLLKPYLRPVEQLKAEAHSEYPGSYKNYFDIAAWAKENTPDSAVICCRKVDMFHLFSNRLVTTFLRTTNVEEQLALLQQGEIDFVVYEQLGFADTERYLLPVIRKYPEKFTIVQHYLHPNTYLLRVIR